MSRSCQDTHKCLPYFKLSLLNITSNFVNTLSMRNLVKYNFLLLHQIVRIYPLFLSRCIPNERDTKKPNIQAG